MSHTGIPSHQSFSGKQVERLTAVAQQSQIDPNSVLWAILHEEAQGQLSHLEEGIRRKIAKLQVVAGRTSGDYFYLYSYQTFSLSDDDKLDPVVAGITFSPDRTNVKIEAEISGEQTGDIILSLPTTTVANSKEDLIEAARGLTRRLSQSADLVAAALLNASRRVD
jgi:hypothetical protein